jgi:hypothetical protein
MNGVFVLVVRGVELKGLNSHWADFRLFSCYLMHCVFHEIAVLQDLNALNAELKG